MGKRYSISFKGEVAGEEDVLAMARLMLRHVAELHRLRGETGKTITLVLELQDPTPSASGKTLGVATTHGNQPTDVTVDGKPLIVGVNAYIRNR